MDDLKTCTCGACHFSEAQHRWYVSNPPRLYDLNPVFREVRPGDSGTWALPPTKAHDTEYCPFCDAYLLTGGVVIPARSEEDDGSRTAAPVPPPFSGCGVAVCVVVGLLIAIVIGAQFVIAFGSTAHPQEVAPDARAVVPDARSAEVAPKVSRPLAFGQGPGELHALRLAKCRVIAALYDTGSRRADFRPYCGFLIDEHERLGMYAPGFEEAWYWSMCYGGANFGLRCFATAPGNCAGPMDVKQWPLVMDPERNIRIHVAEMLKGWRLGYRDRGLCEYVMLPRAPRDWGGGKFAAADDRHRAALRKAHAERRLP